MKILAVALVGAMAFGSLTTGALADGMPGKGRGSVKDSAPAAPKFSWQGYYIGLHGGVASSDVSVTDLNSYNLAPPNNTWSNSDGGSFFGGLTAGYNWQINSAVLGLEGEIGWMDINARTQFPAYQGVPGRVGDSIAGFSTNWYGVIAARAGLTLDPQFLLYAKAGWGWVDADVSFTDTNATGTTLVSGTVNSGTLDGFVYGGGFEWAFARNWSMKMEYLRFDLGSVTNTALTAGGATFRHHHEIEIDTFKAGINYRF